MTRRRLGKRDRCMWMVVADGRYELHPGSASACRSHSSTRCWSSGRICRSSPCASAVRSRRLLEAMFQCLPIVVAVHLFGNSVWGLYGQIWRHASVAEARRVVLAGATGGRPSSRSIHSTRSRCPGRSPCSPPSSPRCSWASYASRRVCSAGGASRPHGQPSPSSAPARRPRRSSARCSASPASRRSPVVVVDDDVRTHGRSLLGVPVVGDVANLDHAVGASRPARSSSPTRAPTRPVARGDGGRRAGQGARQGVPAGPRAADLAPSVRDVRDLRIDDLLGRQQV